MHIDVSHHKDLGDFFTRLNKKLKQSDRFQGKIDFGKHKASKTEFIGTLVHAGFKLIEEKVVAKRKSAKVSDLRNSRIGSLSKTAKRRRNGHLHFTIKKIAPPGSLDEITKAKRLIFTQKRMGKGGKPITIWKLRTMYPMAHKAYEYMKQQSSAGPHGKPKHDFRITPRGKTVRKYWIDEVPQLINILKGDMRLVGYRALSEGFFKTLPKHLQTERLKHKPALMGVTYADRPKNLEQRIKSELRYMQARSQHPLRTDLKYFFKILFAIIFRGQRGY